MGKGILYLSRVPPGMTPTLLRSFLEKTGEIGRIYLRPESPEARKSRRKMGGSYKEYYTDGWVEYLDKKKAKRAVMLLNAQPMGGRRGSRFEGDLWNLKYLKGFQWEDLGASAAVARRLRIARVKGEVARARRERNFWEEKVTTATRVEAMKRKRKRKGLEERDEPDRKRRFRQNEVLDDEEKYGGVDDEEVKSAKEQKIDDEVFNVLFKKSNHTSSPG